MANEQKLMGVLERAKRVMKVTDVVNPIVPSNTGYIPTMTESASMFGIAPVDLGEQYIQQPTNQVTNASKRLPKEILESFEQMPTSAPKDPTFGMSVLDEIIPQQPINTRRQITEDYEQGEKPMPDLMESLRKIGITRNQTPVQPQYTQPQQSTGIDYSLIKLMIDEAISKEFKSLRKTILSESKQVAQNGDVILKVEDTIKFLTKSGKLYEGKLKFIKNVND